MVWDSSNTLEMYDRGSSALRYPGYLGARLRAGNVACDSPMIGDSILVDPTRGFFAIGDSSDREPRAARLFMLKFSDILNDISILSDDVIIPEQQLHDLLNEILGRSRKIMRELPFQGTTTFTGVLFVNTRHDTTKALLFHAGDSMLMAFHPQQGIRTITKKNFWFIGKSQEFYQVAILDVIHGDRFLLATDGLHDLTPPGGKGLNAYIAELFSHYSVENVPDILLGCCDLKTVGRDDLAILTLAPDRPFPNFRGIILGE